MILRWLRNLFAAFAFAVPSFKEHEASTDRGQPLEAPVEHMVNANLARGGTVEPVRKQYGVTIAGGPGSQRIGDTFDALPKAEREAMIAARKGIIRPARPGEMDGASMEQREGEARVGNLSSDKIARGLDRAFKRGSDGRLTPRSNNGNR